MAKSKSRALPKIIQSRRSFGLKWASSISAAAGAANAYAKLKPKKKGKKRQTKAKRRAARLARQKNPPKVQRVRYRRYMKSDHWKARRLLALADAGNRCERCDSILNLHVHHRHYKTLGKEAREDLQVLCRDCHETHHLAEVLGVTHEGLEEYMRR